MSSDVILKVNNVGKRYEIYEAPHHRLFQTLLRGRKQFYKEFWALRDISLEVKRGECIGIIGRNGSGKSTLLQIIAGTLARTTGEVEVNGKVSALLELGSGFNPEFTGRENVYMNGAIIGLTKAEIDKKFDEIAAFADIGDFIEQPVKIYSSGMYVRLAFAVATCADPEILIVDEVLSVGDIYFQAKCMDKIRKMMQKGCATLFVSHSMETVKSLCTQTAYLEDGVLARIGVPEDVVNLYHGVIAKSEIQRHEIKTIKGDSSPTVSNHGLKNQNISQKFIVNSKFDNFPSEDRYGDHRVLIRNVQILNKDEEEVNVVNFLDKIILRYHIEFNIQTNDYNIGFLCRNINGITVFGSRTNELIEEVPLKKKGDRAIVDFVFTNRLGNGVYTISGAVTNRRKFLLPDYHDWINNAVTFKSEAPSAAIWGLLYQEN